MTCCLPDRAVSLSVWWSLPDDNDAETGGRYRPPVFIWPNGFSSRAADAMRSHDVAKLHGPLRTCLARAGRPDHSSFLAGDGWTDRWFRRCITRSGTVGAVRLERLGCVGGIGFCLAVCSPVAAPIGGGAIAEPVPVCRCRSWFEWRASCRTGHDHSPGGCPIPEPAGRAHQVGAGESNLRSIFLKVHLEKRCPEPSTVTELEQYLMRARIEIEASGRLWNQSIQRSQSFRLFRNSASATACCCRFIGGRGNGSDCSSGGGGQRSDRPDRIRAGCAMRPG
jgi:hypothetical protein